MKYKQILNVIENKEIAQDIFLMKLNGDINGKPLPGQFINIKIDGFFLRRPISVCDYDDIKKEITIIYKIFGKGTKKLSQIKPTEKLDILYWLGNGFDLDLNNNKLNIVLISGGVGLPPIFFLAKYLKNINKKFKFVVGFKNKSQSFFLKELNEFKDVFITTEDGSIGYKGFATYALERINYDYYFACGPKLFLKSIISLGKYGQLSLEEKMACGFGVCMSCTCVTKNGPKKLCIDGPILKSDEVIL